ncbi:MAG: WD40 repeat domain-containing serine/threonine protein kinase [Fimbriiglobus sp.]
MTNAIPCNKTECPSDQALRLLLDQDSSPEVTEHVGECTGCQGRLETIATGEAPHLSQVLLTLPKSEPDKDSAYWSALNEAEHALTQVYNDSPRSEDVKLDFLTKTSTPGRLGRISTFEVKRVIGRGGMGVVLQGYDPVLARDVAIKVLDPMLANNETARQRFCREARAAAAMNHDNLVTVHQVDEDPNSKLPFLVMQLVNGESLEQRLKRVKRLPVIETVKMGMQAAAGLATAHGTGLIHRDIKPGNILIEAGSEKTLLTDFGLARAAEDMKLTRTGFVAGTPLYMAPEQARGDEIDARVDLFSLGSVMYETLAGRPPFEGRTPLAVLRRVADEAHDPLHKINPEVPEWLEDTIDRLLSKEPGDRFQTAQELAEFLAVKYSAMLQLNPKSGTSAKTSSKSSLLVTKAQKKAFCARTASTVVGAFAAGLALGGVAMFLMLYSPQTPAPNPAEVTPPLAAAIVPPVEESAAPLTTFPSKAGAIWAIALAPDGKTVATGVESGKINIWERTTKRLLYELHPDAEGIQSAHTGPIWALDYSADGNFLISISDDGNIKTWQLNDGKLKKTFPLGESIRTACISPDGNLVALGDRKGFVQVFNILEERQMLRYDQGSTVNAIAFSEDSLSLASAGTDGRLVLYDIPGNRRRWSAMAHDAPIYTIAFSPDNQRLATAGWDQVVHLWDLNNKERIGQPIVHPEGIWCVQFTSCGRMLATGGQDGRTRVFDIEDNNKMLLNYGRHRGPVHSMRFVKDGQLLITGGRDGNVHIWDSACHQPK